MALQPLSEPFHGRGRSSQESAFVLKFFLRADAAESESRRVLQWRCLQEQLKLEQEKHDNHGLKATREAQRLLLLERQHGLAGCPVRSGVTRWIHVIVSNHESKRYHHHTLEMLH